LRHEEKEMYPSKDLITKSLTNTKLVNKPKNESMKSMDLGPVVSQLVWK